MPAPLSLSSQLDQFYTNEIISQKCIDFLEKKIVNNNDYFFIEPSAGTGAFLKHLKKSNKNILGFDLDPKYNDIILLDFLSLDISQYSNVINTKPIITIGNPPFGKNSSLALKFLNKASQFSQFIGFILPRTFKKQSIINKINPNLHLLAELDIPSNSFIFNELPYNVPCVFQIWEKKDTLRIKEIQQKTHDDFSFTDSENADFAIRRVGVLAGKVIMDFQKFSPESHYYIKSNIPILLILNRFSKINWDEIKNNTAGNPSISKPELIQLYSQI